MSGSGGFYKYRCKYFMTHDCPNWVFVNYAPCADCCAAGRDADEMRDDGQSSGFYHSHHALYAAAPEFEIGVPLFQDGILSYSLARLTSSLEPGSDFASWTTHQPPMSAGLSSSNPSQDAPQGQDFQHVHSGQNRQHAPFSNDQQSHGYHQLRQSPQFPHQPHPPPQLIKLQGSSPGRQTAEIKMQLPPHAAIRAFPVATATGGIDDMMPTGAAPGLLLY
ncbi:hypothetical protein HMPREF1624_06815 [Sporothrix schenckii ATCC 58251]|uniref:Uncharacterized protein n=1 Tax=Sporothrix schenckii (strain ATCC 58251 / de Perez 2211183) TaxID=1391915 RepID=U7PNU7_SPOS1|nr:hypothetical protein HMPREF1624_06815 [Sporothrix schenckii ATCC 58251]